MIRHDFACPECGHEDMDRVINSNDVDRVICPCGARMHITFRQRTRNAQWSERDGIVLYREASGKFRYPGRNDEPTPAGCERVEIRSMSELARHERETGTVSEIRHFDTKWRGLESQPGYDGRPMHNMRGERG